VAPSLLAYEVVNTLHKYHRAGHLSPASAELSLGAILSLPIELAAVEPRLHLRALTIARELSLPAADDAHYLALSEDLNGEFWTADRRLWEAVHGELPWVRLIGEEL
jgi:predicted nucleic acid-binding protein